MYPIRQDEKRAEWIAPWRSPQQSLRVTKVRGNVLAEQAHRALDVLMWNGGHGYAADQIGDAKELAIALDLCDDLGRVADDKTVPAKVA